MSKDPLYLVTDTPDGYQSPPGHGVYLYRFIAYDHRRQPIGLPVHLTLPAVELLSLLFDLSVIPLAHCTTVLWRSHPLPILTDVISDEHFEDDERLEADTLAWRRNAR